MAKAPEQPKAGETTQTMLDPSKLMGGFDTGKLMGDLSNSLKQLKIPGLDTEAMVQAQKSNLEALTNANRAVYEGFQAIAKRQAEMLQESMHQTTLALRDVGSAGSPPEMVAKQAELAKAALQRTLTTMQDMADIATKSNNRATQVISDRMAETLDEIRDMALKAKK
jgi:phasin family protein